MMKFHTGFFFFFSFLRNNILRKKSAISGGNWKQGRVENRVKWQITLKMSLN